LGVHPAQAAVLSSSISLASVATHPPVPTAMEATNQRHDTSAGSLVTLNRKGYLAEKAYKVAEPAKPIATARTIAAATTRASAGAITTTATGYFKDFLCTQITKAVVCLSSL
jgi:hypothetical protein